MISPSKLAFVLVGPVGHFNLCASLSVPRLGSSVYIRSAPPHSCLLTAYVHSIDYESGFCLQ